MLLKLVIIEDDECSQIILENLLKTYFMDIVLVGKARNVAEGIKLIHSNAPDLILADVPLGGETIFDLIKNLKNKEEHHFIITTAHENFALEAISHGVVDYILKPITIENLTLAINKFKRRLIAAQEREQLNAFDTSGNRLLGIAAVDKIEVLDIDAIVYIQADGRYTHFHLIDGTKKTASKNLGEYEKILPIQNFVRVHHSYIVNMNYVKSIQKTDGYFVQLFKSDKVIPIAKRKQDTIIKFLKLKT
jgi:two-component system LytT family response regulator